MLPGVSDPLGAVADQDGTNFAVVSPGDEVALEAGRLRHAFSGREECLQVVATVVLAQGRAPEGALWESLDARPGCAAAGDVLGPRSLEEAVLEGTLAVREGPR